VDRSSAQPLTAGPRSKIKSTMHFMCRLTPQFSGRVTRYRARRERIMK
jgi:hypothetical protein